METSIITNNGQKKPQRDVSAELEAYKGWEKTTNEKTGFYLFSFLKKVCDAYQAESEQINQEFEASKQNIELQRQKTQEDIGRKAMHDQWKTEQDYLNALSDLQQIEQSAYIVFFNDFNTYSFYAQTRVSGIKKLIERILGSSFDEEERLVQETAVQMEASRNQLCMAIDKQRKIISELHEIMKESDSNRSETSSSSEDSRYTQELQRLIAAHSTAIENLNSKFLDLLDRVAGKNCVIGYKNIINKADPGFENYSCAKDIPTFIHLGEVTYELGRKAELIPELSQLFSSHMEHCLEKKTLGVLTAKLPYCQTLSDGISLFVNYSPAESKLYQEYLKTIILKLFMVFPAGKLEATMIDPLELGGTFSIFSKLGEEQSRIIDTKIWSQERDIDEAINILRQKIETMTQAYGDDTASRLKKEPIRVLAITDFPTGFSAEALRDLQAIVRKSASYGVCVFIWANSEEVEKMQAAQQSVFNEIKQMLHVASSKEGKLILENAGLEGITLHLDQFGARSQFLPSVIHTLSQGIHNAANKIEHFEDMYSGIDDPNNWFKNNTIKELSIPIGIKGANTIVKLVMGKTDGSTAHHALIAGQTGAGKSTLLHTIILSTLLNYSPDEVEMYLIDFKEGVEFKTYSRLNLPSVRVVAIDCEREFGLNILKELQNEMKRRYDLFKREADREEISDYRKITGAKIPKILVIFDEIQELFRGNNSDDISKECEVILGELLTLGRAAGIHMILASQNFNLISFIKPTLFAHAAIRIAIKGSEDSAMSVLGESNDGAKQLQDGSAGAAVYNDGSGKESANVVFQVGYIEKGKRAEYLKKLSDLQNTSEYKELYPHDTRVLLTSVEDDIFNPFNQFIEKCSIGNATEDNARYPLIIGEGFDLHEEFTVCVAPQIGRNIMAIGNDEKQAISLFCLTILSLLHDDLCNDEVKKDKNLINLIDLSDKKVQESHTTNLEHLSGLFPKQIKRAAMKDLLNLISETHKTLRKRMECDEGTEERVFLLIFGINRAHKLLPGGMYEDPEEGELSPREKLIEVIEKGPRFGINTICWGDELDTTTKILGANYGRCFLQRIVFSSDKETFERLVMERSGEQLRQTTAVFMDVDNNVKNTHFRIYEIPTRKWIEDYAKRYHTFE